MLDAAVNLRLRERRVGNGAVPRSGFSHTMAWCSSETSPIGQRKSAEIFLGSGILVLDVFVR
jgi:hypothetical protein